MLFKFMLNKKKTKKFHAKSIVKVRKKNMFSRDKTTLIEFFFSKNVTFFLSFKIIYKHSDHVFSLKIVLFSLCLQIISKTEYICYIR